MKLGPEGRISAQIAAWCHAWLPDDAWATAIPGGGRRFMQGLMWKAMGYRAGTPDWLIIYKKRVYFVELKSADGRVSRVQKECHWAIENTGALVAMAWSLDDFQEALRVWGIPHRGEPRHDPDFLPDALPW